MRRHLLGFLKVPTVGEIDRDAGRPESVTPDLCPDPGRLGPPLNHFECVGTFEHPV